jgi:hypothetical protein
MFSVLFPPEQFLGANEITYRPDLDSISGHVDGDSPEGQIVVSTFEPRWFEHDVDQTSRGDESEGDRRAKDVARFEPVTVDPEALRDLIDPPSTAEGVQGVTETLQVAFGSLGDDIHVHRLQIGACSQPAKLPKIT